MTQNILICFSGLFLIVVGLLSIFAKDIMWEITVWQNQAKGLASERTDRWDTGTTIGGVMGLLAGLFLLFILFNGGIK
jgi:hypothetical protein